MLKKFTLKDVLIEDGSNLEEITLHGHPLHWFSPANQFSMSRILLVGDATGVDPFFGEGIGPALGYGEIAASELENAFARDDFSFGKYRRHILLSPLGRYLSWRWVVARVMYRLSGHPWFMHTLWMAARVLISVHKAVSGNRKSPANTK